MVLLREKPPQEQGQTFNPMPCHDRLLPSAEGTYRHSKLLLSNAHCAYQGCLLNLHIKQWHFWTYFNSVILFANVFSPTVSL